MILKSEILEIASILDEDIEKAERAEQTRVEVYEEQISKALSHDPFRPVVMGTDSPYYNPYRQMEDGSFLPHPVGYWESQGKNTAEGQYLTTRVLYEHYLAPTESSFNTLRRSLESCDLIKAGAVPVGTVHTYRDGQRYKKMGEGRWVPVGGNEGAAQAQKFQEGWLNHKDPERQQMAHKDLERHASQTAAVTEAIKKKEAEERIKKETKHEAMTETMKKVKQAMSSLFDGPMPEQLKNFFDKHEEKAKKDGKPPEAPEESIKKIHNNLNKKHNVTVSFSVGAKQFEHQFPEVAAQGTSEATSKVQDLFNNHFRAARVHRIRAEVVRPKKEAKQGEK